MITALIVVVLIFWFLGFVGPWAVGEMVHLLLLIVVVLVFMQFASGRRDR